MKWEWNEAPSPDIKITDVKYREHNGYYLVNWKWPEDIQYVLIHSENMNSIDHQSSSEVKLYTREEYKANQGYRLKLAALGKFSLTIHACIREGNTIIAYRQDDDANIVEFRASRAKIKYSIKYKSGLFSKNKRVQIELYSEITVPKEALCYVKKTGSMPLDKDDGVMYPFIEDVFPGENKLAEFEIGKQDQIKLFFTDKQKYGTTYELIPR